MREDFIIITMINYAQYAHSAHHTEQNRPAILSSIRISAFEKTVCMQNIVVVVVVIFIVFFLLPFSTYYFVIK